jgi:uncharacterized protein YifE (UPF0438 family)
MKKMNSFQNAKRYISMKYVAHYFKRAIEFGVKELEVLKKKFKGILELQVIDISEIQTEWQYLKKLVYKRYR